MHRCPKCEHEIKNCPNCSHPLDKEKEEYSPQDFLITQVRKPIIRGTIKLKERPNSRRE